MNVSDAFDAFDATTSVTRPLPSIEVIAYEEGGVDNPWEPKTTFIVSGANTDDLIVIELRVIVAETTVSGTALLLAPGGGRHHRVVSHVEVAPGVHKYVASGGVTPNALQDLVEDGVLSKFVWSPQN